MDWVRLAQDPAGIVLVGWMALASWEAPRSRTSPSLAVHFALGSRLGLSLEEYFVREAKRVGRSRSQARRFGELDIGRA
jgi:hypothetical protein